VSLPVLPIFLLSIFLPDSSARTPKPTIMADGIHRNHGTKAIDRKNREPRTKNKEPTTHPRPPTFTKAHFKDVLGNNKLDIIHPFLYICAHNE
jgi:hypothetical protein